MQQNNLTPEERKKKLFSDRKRTNILRDPEQKLITFFLKHTPKFVTPNMMTFIGMMGSFLVFLGFLMAYYLNYGYLFLCILGLFINWLGDSLDGRLAYYRGTPRKWYGFSLDIIMDWASTVLIGFGYYIYVSDYYEFIGFLLVVLYAWAMIISQLRYKITGKYSIDSGSVGPTEIRVVLAIIIFIEYFVHNSLPYFAASICAILFFLNIMDTRKLLDHGNQRDAEEKKNS